MHSLSRRKSYQQPIIQTFEKFIKKKKCYFVKCQGFSIFQWNFSAMCLSMYYNSKKGASFETFFCERHESNDCLAIEIIKKKGRGDKKIL